MAAQDIDLPGLDACRAQLDGLADAVVVDARYPLIPVDSTEFHVLKNGQTTRIWSTGGFRRSVALALRIRKHVTAIDSDRADPMSARAFAIDEDGFTSPLVSI